MAEERMSDLVDSHTQIGLEAQWTGKVPLGIVLRWIRNGVLVQQETKVSSIEHN